ncbi:hypothetical protein ACIGG6_02320 [Vreelandella lionensis]|uniref:Uncharacterized protein n=1 Tax=Vreelandella lionensis TaxID=1144478 RepID=A0ABW8BPE8_9GAMM
MDDITVSPLSWPATKPRTPVNKRNQGSFGQRNSSGWSLKELTVAESRDRVMPVLDKFIRHCQTYRVPPDSININTDLALRMNSIGRKKDEAMREPN